MVCTSLVSHCTALQVAGRRLQAEGLSCLMCNSFEHGHKNLFPSLMSQMVPFKMCSSAIVSTLDILFSPFPTSTGIRSAAPPVAQHLLAVSRT